MIERIAALHESGCVKGFGRRPISDDTRARGPSSESRQGRKAREVEHPGSGCAMGIWLVPAVRRAPAGAASAAARRAERAD